MGSLPAAAGQSNPAKWRVQPVGSSCRDNDRFTICSRPWQNAEMNDPLVAILLRDLYWLTLVVVGFGFVMALFLFPTFFTIYGRTWWEFFGRVLLSWFVGVGSCTGSFLLLINLGPSFPTRHLYASASFVVGCWCVYRHLRRPDFWWESSTDEFTPRCRFVFSLRTFMLIQFALIAACGLWAVCRRTELKQAYERRHQELQRMEQQRKPKTAAIEDDRTRLARDELLPESSG